MKLLLDTHAFAWWMIEKGRLSQTALEAIAAPESEVFVSIASAWEMSIKVGYGRWPAALPLVESFATELSSEHFQSLPIVLGHVRAAGLMQSPHRDPFDRLLAAQAMIEGLTLVTADGSVQSLVTDWLW